MSRPPSWLTDEELDKAEALGREIERFLRRRRKRKRIDPNCKVDIGPRLRKILANIEREER
jgi:hypothetical protein